MTNGYTTAIRAIEALDLSAENEQVQALEQQIAEIAEATSRAEARRTEIRRTFAALRENDGEAVADALLQGDDARQAAHQGPDEKALREELAALGAGIGDLERRRVEAKHEIERIRDQATMRAAESTKPMVDAIASDMRAAAQALLTGYAALSAVNEATRGHGSLLLAGRYAVDGLKGMDRLLPDQKQASVPAPVIETLAGLNGKGAALRPRLISTAPLH